MINIINIDKFLIEHQAKGPVISSQSFIGKGHSFHPSGIFSEDLFGIYGSPERRDSCSWIELNCPVIHPAIYDILYKRIEKKIEPLLMGEVGFDLDTSGIIIPNDDIEKASITGMTSLYNNIDKIKFREDPDDPESDRNKIIDMLYTNIKKGTFFMTKLIVIPPDYRPLMVNEETGEVTSDPINDLYQRIIILSNQVKNVSGSLFDILSFKMQMYLRDLYELVRMKVSKKYGMIRRLMLGKRVDFSARAVISPEPTLKLGEAGVPLRIVCQLFEPQIIYGLVNSNYANKIPDEFFDEVKKFLGKERDLDIDI